MYRYLVEDIDWDTDGEDADLPSSVLVMAEAEADDEIISDALSDAFDYCHCGFHYDEFRHIRGFYRSGLGVIFLGTDGRVR